MDRHENKDKFANISLNSRKNMLFGMLGSLQNEFAECRSEIENYKSIMKSNGSKEHVTMPNRRCMEKIFELKAREASLFLKIDALQYAVKLMDTAGLDTEKK